MSLVDTFLNWGVFRDALPLLLTGLWVTLELGVAAVALGLAGGLPLVLLRLYGAAPARLAAVAYIDVFRAIPVLVLLIVIYYALPFVGLRLSPFASATAALSLVSAAYSAEILRAGIEAVPPGQVEAARALGMPPPLWMRRIVLPQAVRLVVPPLTSNAINVFKDTALASVVAMPDLLKQATQAQALAANPTPLIGAAAIYVALLLPCVRFVGLYEGRLRRRAR